MMPSLMIDHLSINLRSGTDNLVSEISFAIKEGESLILLGQSGSGKTMTCSAVLNLLDPKKFKVSGSVFFGETDLLNSSEKQRRGIYGNQIVYIPQNPMTALDPSMRIGRQMDETLRLHSDKSRQQRYNYILRLLHDVGLDDPDRVYRALDLGEFIDSNGNSYIDIVELNPISCSMCYVNNSIYADVVPEIGECQRQLMMGAEFCYDAIANPKNYDMLRISNKSYTYTSDNQYALL